MRLAPEAADLSNAVILGHVTKVTTEKVPQLIFGSMTAVLPTRRRLAVLGRQGSGRTTLLRLVGRTEPVDAGQIITRTKFSMLLNHKPFLHGEMSGIENVETLARIYALPPKRLAEMAAGLPGLPRGAWFEPVGTMMGRPKRTMEMLIAALLPFDCYLLDDMERADPVVALTFIKMITARGAGLIFTTFNARTARQHGDCAAVIANHSVRVFESVSEAEKFYDR